MLGINTRYSKRTRVPSRYTTIDLVRELEYPHGTKGQFLKIRLGSQRVKPKQVLL